MGQGERLQGFYDMPFEEYRRQSWAISSSDLNLLLRAPSLYKHVAIDGHRRASTKALIEGSAVHAAILEPEVFKREYVIAPTVNKRTLKGREDLELFQCAHNGKILIDEADHARFTAISSIVRAHSNASELLKACEFEKSFFWKQQHYDLHSKARADALNLDGNYIVDLKTTRDVKDFTHSIEQYGYHRQAAYYLNGVSQLAGRNINTWYWIAVETTAPYLCKVFKASQEMLTAGAIETKILLSRLEKCTKENSFPSLPEGIEELQLSQRYVERSRSNFTEGNL